jgi:hypothetical protein
LISKVKRRGCDSGPGLRYALRLPEKSRRIQLILKLKDRHILKLSDTLPWLQPMLNLYWRHHFQSKPIALLSMMVANRRPNCLLVQRSASPSGFILVRCPDLPRAI